MPPACSCGRARGSSSPSGWRTSRRSSAPGSASRWRASGVLVAAAAAPAARCAPTCVLVGDRRPAAVRHHLRADLLGRAVRDVRAGRRSCSACCRSTSRCSRRRSLPDEPLRPRLLARRRRSRSAGSSLAFGESLDLGRASTPRWPRWPWSLSPLASAIGNVAIKKRGAKLDPLVMNGWAMLIGGGVLLLVVARRPRTGARRSGRSTSIGSILYLAAFGTGFTFVTLTVLLRELPAVTVSFISMIIPFGALALGALFRDEHGDRAGRRRRAAGGRRDRGRAVAARRKRA